MQFAAALKYLGVLDGKKVTRAAVDLLYIEVLKDQHRPGKSSMPDADVCYARVFSRMLTCVMLTNAGVCDADEC